VQHGGLVRRLGGVTLHYPIRRKVWDHHLPATWCSTYVVHGKRSKTPRELGAGFIMPPQNKVSPFPAVGQFSSISAIPRGEVRDE
jgi:hypothetical protein